MVMNLREEFQEAHEWVRHSLTFDIDQDVSMFETTIRVLGSLLSTYHLTRDRLYLDKAVDLAGRGTSMHSDTPRPAAAREGCKDDHIICKATFSDRLLGAFATPSGIPFCYLNLRTGRGHEVVSSTAEVRVKAMFLVKSMDRVEAKPGAPCPLSPGDKHPGGVP